MNYDETKILENIEINISTTNEHLKEINTTLKEIVNELKQTRIEFQIMMAKKK